MSTAASTLVRRSPAHEARVVGVRDLTPRMRRVTIRADAMLGVQIKPAQDVELLLREPSGRRVKRRYTIRHVRPDTGELDLDVVLHGDGPGARWAAAAQIGDDVEFQGPRGKLELRSAAAHMLVGDESALPAIAAICAALPPGEPATALIEITDASDELPVAAAVRWVHRGEAAAGGADLLLDAARDVLASSEADPAAARGYLMGETRAMVALRALLENHGVPHESIFVKGYWNLGRPDRLAGRAPT
ncbi:siderophore-interacting protein, partial [uncultured Jatrophihabitans sp.]|uniref:siderophore-interacting protein n=1 Tax=uncultured Jatrophihabitans sp. TaxID=1610747 RepID=UPI0035CC5C74